MKIMTGKNGAPRETWYARFTRNGQKVNVNLRVPIAGKVPVDAKGSFDVNGKGDAAFEKSRKAAEAALRKMQAAAKTTGKSEAVRNAEAADLANRYYRARMGKSIKAVDTRLDELPGLWRSLPRETPATEERLRIYDATFKDFAKFAATYAAAHDGECETLNTITPEMASAWFDELRGEYAWETVKNKMSLLSGAYTRWATSGAPNPFVQIIKRHRGEGRIQRRPVTEQEIARVLECARGDEFYYPLIVCAACTGMRLGDVCNLHWADVDLSGGFIDCVTAKAGVRVTIPIFKELQRVLEARLAERADGEAFVFPLAASKYNKVSAGGNVSERSTIVRGVKPYIAQAVQGDKPVAEDAQLAGAAVPTTDEVLAMIEASRFAPGKKERVLDTYRRYAAGESYADITTATGRHKGQITQDLQAVEQLAGIRIRPGDKYARRRPTKKTARALVELTRKERAVGKCRASIYGWHSFRTGFVVMAVENGVPIEDVQKIVGHTTVRMTMDYYRPTKQHAAERVKRQMSGTVLEGRQKKIGATVDVGGGDLAPVPVDNARRAFALVRAMLDKRQAAAADGLLAAAGIDAEAEPGRAVAVICAAMPDEAKRIGAVCKAAGIVL